MKYKKCNIEIYKQNNYKWLTDNILNIFYGYIIKKDISSYISPYVYRTKKVAYKKAKKSINRKIKLNLI